MIRGLPASVAIHVGVLFAGTIAWPYLSVPAVDYIPIPIEIEIIDEETNIAPSIEEEEAPEEEAPPELEETLEEPEAEPDEEEELPEEEQETSVEEEKQEESKEEDIEKVPEDVAEDEPEPEPKEEEEEPEPEPEKKPERVVEPETDEFDDFLSDVDNLLSKEPEVKKKAPPPAPPRELADERPQTESRISAGDRSRITSSMQNIIMRQMRDCWTDIDDLPNPERLTVSIRISLARDGALVGDAKLVRPSRPPIGDPPMQQAIQRALRAARKCSPYKIPEGALDDYNNWKDITLNFGTDTY